MMFCQCKVHTCAPTYVHISITHIITYLRIYSLHTYVHTNVQFVHIYVDTI